MATTSSIAEQSPAASRAQIVFQIVVLGLLLALLVNYKGTAGLRRINQAHTTGVLKLSSLPVGKGDGAIVAFSRAIAYLKIVWPALVFGILISAAV